MKLNVIGWLLSIVILAASAPKANADENYSSYLLNRVNLVDPGTETVIPNAWIKIKNGKIHSLGNGPVPSSPKTIDMKNQYLLPGFIDGHMHLTSGPLTAKVVNGVPKLSLKSNDDVTRYHAIAAMASGITSVFSPAGDPIANKHYQQQRAKGEWIGPKIHFAGLSFDPTPIEGGSIYPTSEEAWNKEIERQRSLGAKYIKLYHGLSESELKTAINLAHEQGMKTIGHLDEISWQTAVDLGIDALTHALPTSSSLLPEDKRAAYQNSRAPMSSKHMYQWFELADFESKEFTKLLDSLLANKVSVDLTLVVNEMTYFYRQFDEIYPDNEYLHPQVAKTFKQHMGLSTYNWTDDDFARAKQAFTKVLEMVKLMVDKGVQITIGSDSYSGGPIFWRELQLHEKVGLDRWKILQMITSDAAERLALKNVGFLKKGMQADFTVLKADPLQSPLSIDMVSTVIQDGILHQSEELKLSLAKMK